ncbi:Uncharacterized membrane protein YccC [Lutibacter agarilyticus]|uniref:Uncharacterized membrane protein YccC n=1 Tax=Lutibacter agarilyticus TaxID=1109740 RepID=A0A238WJ25_9FLAO|nr:FUSC family membrane protein [Lutibacter agarilyticus]SNR46234.1 Uncharacterized membrane protein YccC [Lutibacter agarilyticus]
MKAIVMAIAIILPIFLSFYYLNDINLGVSVALGVLFCSPADIPGSVKHNFYGILLAVLLSVLVTLLFGSLINYFWLLLPLLGVIVFFISYLSVFGFRASLIAFGGLFAIVLSFSHDYNETSVVTHALLVGLGGLWYVSLSMVRLFLFPRAQTDFLFGEVTEKTAEFLRVRGELLMRTSNRTELYKKLFQLQTEITDLLEILRTIILQSRKESEFSNRIRRQQLFFSELVDILELAISNPVDYENFDVVFEKHQDKVAIFKDLIFEMANELDHISKVIRKEEKLTISEKLDQQLSDIGREIDYYRILVGLPKSRIGTLMLSNLKKYQEKQVQNITGLKRILGNYSYNNKITISRDSDKFITPQDYDLKKLQENFSFKSPIFKHSLRLAIVFLIGFLIGKIFEMQNPYWIMLTIIVIMRPSYGLTKQRSINRVIGTLIGAAIAIAIILVTQNTIIYAVISIISLPIALSIMQKNYRNAAIFITLNVIFVFALLEPNILSVIKFRIFDTLIGAFLSFASIYFLWPSWEFQNVGEYITDALKNNKKFLEQISIFYHEKGDVTTTYKLSRKAAFLAIGNLNAAFERMNQDPKSKQKDVGTIYKLVVVNNTFLSSLSSLGTFIRHNKTSEVPVYFEVFIENIKLNLQLSIELLEENESEKVKSSNIKKAHLLYENSFEKLSNKRDEEIAQGIEVSTEMAEQLKETHLVSEQVKWLYNLSEKMLAAIRVVKF